MGEGSEEGCIVLGSVILNLPRARGSEPGWPRCGERGGRPRPGLKGPVSSLCSGLTGDPVSSFQVPPVSCHPEDLETLPGVAEVRAQELRSWGGGHQSAGGQTGLSDPCSLHSWQPCLPRTKFHCPLVFKEEILVQVTGTVELVEEIKVAGGSGRRGGGAPGLSSGLPRQMGFLHFSLLPGCKALIFPQRQVKETRDLLEIGRAVIMGLCRFFWVLGRK